MSEPIRCPKCGGINPPTAEWCGQCLQRLSRAVPPPPPPPPPASDDLVGELHDLVDEEAMPGASPGPAVRRGAFTVEGEAIVWHCAVCDNVNPLGAQVCEICGTPFADLVREPEPERPPRDANTAAMLSLFLPGAGHFYVGKLGEAVARAILSIWVVAVTLVTGIYGSGASSVAGAVLFGLAAFGLWLTAAHDAYREARREPALVILKGRLYLYLVIGLLSLLMFLLLGAALQFRAG